MIDFSVVIGRRVPENHPVRGDGTSDFQIAINRGFFQIGLPIGHVQTVIHLHRCIEIRVSVYRHRVRRIRAEDDVAFKVSIPCGRDRFSRQPLHLFDIALVIHFDTAFDGGLSLLRVTCDTAGAFICFHDFIGICFGLLIKLYQIVGYILVFLDIVLVFCQTSNSIFSICLFLCNGIRIRLCLLIKLYQVVGHILVFLDIVLVFCQVSDSVLSVCLFLCNGIRIGLYLGINFFHIAPDRVVLVNIFSAFLRSNFSPIDGLHTGDCARIESDAINARAKGCIIRDLGGLILQPTDPRLVCTCLIHGIFDIRQCGGHARAIADFPNHLQRARFHISTGNRGSTDGSHTGQRRTVRRELRGLLLQIGDFAFIRGDTVSSGF